MKGKYGHLARAGWKLSPQLNLIAHIRFINLEIISIHKPQGFFILNAGKISKLIKFTVTN